MKKSDLKQLIKPLVKECIHEVLIEEGLLSNVVAEVAKGMQGNLVVENKQKKPQQRLIKEDIEMQERAHTARNKLRQHRETLMDSINSEAYNGVNLFEGTEPMNSYESASPKAGSVDLGSPKDSGVDISSLMGDASRIWQAMKQG